MAEIPAHIKSGGKKSDVVEKRALFVSAVDTELYGRNENRNRGIGLAGLRGARAVQRPAGRSTAFASLALAGLFGPGSNFDTRRGAIDNRMRRRTSGSKAGQKRKQGNQATKHCIAQIGRVTERVHPA